jgi:hypothetical protein
MPSATVEQQQQQQQQQQQEQQEGHATEEGREEGREGGREGHTLRASSSLDKSRRMERSFMPKAHPTKMVSTPKTQRMIPMTRCSVENQKPSSI